jgi:hypothetical protein
MSPDRKLSLAWGAKAIGEELGLTAQRAYYKLEAGHIRSARKVGKEWVADRHDLRREFTQPADSVTRSGRGIDGAG